MKMLVRMKPLLWMLPAFVLIAILGVLGYLVYEGYHQSWSGFQAYTNEKGELIPPKRLWDWLNLLIIPAILAIGIWWLNKAQKRSEQQIETDRQRQQALEDYFDCMTNLLLNGKLRDLEKGSEARCIARTRTLAVLRNLDTKRRAQVLQFLSESKLINKKNPVVKMCGADLRGAELDHATLGEAALIGVHLDHAHLRGASLQDADLRGSDFTSADLRKACLTSANLEWAILSGADLDEACGINANLKFAVLKDAKNWQNADWTGADQTWADKTKGKPKWRQKWQFSIGRRK